MAGEHHRPPLLEAGLWYARRLRAMSPSEIVGRVVTRARVAVWRRRRDWHAPEADVGRIPSPPAPIDPTALLATSDAVVAEASEILRGHYRLLGLEFDEVPIDWHRDPQTGRHAPRRFAFDIAYRRAEVVGNVKNIWEKNRHHHLSVLATAYAATRDDRFAREIERQLLDWIEANGPLHGVNWTSSLELGIRLIAWVWIERCLRGSDAHPRLFGARGVMWPQVYWHQRIIAEHRSQGSSANNHLIGEMAGLYIAARAWPVFPESNRWQSDAGRSLERESARQTFASGLNREQAFGYHLFVLEFLLLSVAESGTDGLTRSRDTARRMLGVLSEVADVAGNLPTYGDADEGMAVQLRGAADSRLAWIGALAAAVGVGHRAENPVGSIAFRDAGVFILASRRWRENEILCVADAGPHGFLSIAAHGHADALSFTVNVGGVPVIVDPGTFTYHLDAVRRRYFRSTRGHNTIALDAEDQATQTGPFLWGSSVDTTVREWVSRDDGARLVAEHAGYARLPGRPIHRRSLDLADRELSIHDELNGTGDHAIDWRLHLADRCRLRIEGSAAVIEWTDSAGAASRATVALDPRLSWRILHGEPDGGWYAPRFNDLRPAPTLAGSGRVALPAVFHHVIRFS